MITVLACIAAFVLGVAVNEQGTTAAGLYCVAFVASGGAAVLWFVGGALDTADRETP